MIKQIRYIKADGMNPYENLATEAQLLETVGEDECILYLWQNQRTVVIGRNQNCYKECRLEKLAQDGGFLARRLSGGGAVFHDAGNLNFTFLTQQANYNVDYQLAVILQAVQSFGIAAEKNGRNDLTIQGRKFSGNAFYHHGKRHYHHGTILIQADMGQLAHYLQVAPAKLRAKGVDSVRARVANLVDYNRQITVAAMMQALLTAFSAVYGVSPQPLAVHELNPQRHRALAQKFAAADWLYGKNIAFTCAYERRFAWGDLQLQLQVNEGIIIAAAAFSDALDGNFIAKIPAALQNCAFMTAILLERLREIAATPLQHRMVEDIGRLLRGDGVEEEKIDNTI